MTKLLFVTHPNVVIDPDIPIDQWSLSEEGLKRIESLARLDVWNGVTTLYSSTEPKALTVARHISKEYDLPLPKEHEVYDLGEVRGRTFIPPEEFKASTKVWFDHPDERINGRETRNDTQKRIVSCVSEIMESETEKSVAIIGHGGTGTLLKCFIKQIEPTQEEDQPGQGHYFIADWGNKLLISDWIKY